MAASMSPKVYVAEFLGSLLLTGVVIGSGILAAQFSGGNDGVALLGNTAATAAILFVLVTTLGPVSGAHLNPAVTVAFVISGETPVSRAFTYMPVQILGCVAGALLAHAMFELPLIQIASNDRAGLGKILGEVVATFALVFGIFGSRRFAPTHVALAVALIITAGYWWTPSTSFANPAITIARSLSDTFAGIDPANMPGFIAGQLIGASLAAALSRWLFAPDS